jgi:hypothetical protein
LYREVDMEYAREKVSHALRSRLSSSKMKKKRSVTVNDEDSDQQKRRRKSRHPRNSSYCKWTKEEEDQIQIMICEQQRLLQTLLQH